MNKIEKIRQEIERLKKILEESTYYLDNSQQALGYSFALDDFSAFIDSLPDEPVDYAEELKKCKDNPLYFYDKYVKVKQEHSEVDLEKEIEKELRLHYNDDQDVYWWNYLKNSFYHFYELGLNARKEESK